MVYLGLGGHDSLGPGEGGSVLDQGPEVGGQGEIGVVVIVEEEDVVHRVDGDDDYPVHIGFS